MELLARAGGNINRVRDEIAAWFDGGMNRVAGAYKRKTQIWSFVIALVLAGALNVDTIKIANTLWQQPMITKSIGPPSGGKTAVDALSQFEELNKLGLPFGWNDKARTDFFKRSELAIRHMWLAHHCHRNTVRCAVLVRLVTKVRAAKRGWLVVSALQLLG